MKQHAILVCIAAIMWGVGDEELKLFAAAIRAPARKSDPPDHGHCKNCGAVIARDDWSYVQ